MRFKIQLKTKNSYYVCAEAGGGRELVANRTVAAEWETFTLITTSSKLEDGVRVGLIAPNGQFVTAIGGGGTRLVVATKETQSNYETFALRKVAGANQTQSGSIVSGDKVAFCCYSGKHYLAAANGGGSIFTCEPPWMDVDEMFTINILPPVLKPVLMLDKSATKVKALFSDRLTVISGNSAGQMLKWRSSNDTVVTVDSSGLYTGKKVGVADIIVGTADGLQEARCRVYVYSEIVTVLGRGINILEAETITVIYGNYFPFLIYLNIHDFTIQTA